MNILIIGGGKVGYYLAKTLLSYHHKVKVIELKRELCEKAADELNIPVYNGDATQIEVLENAEVSKADILIAVTGLDEENLIACQLAKSDFGVKKTIARVNNPKNTKIFLALGVDFPISSTTLIADIIEEEVDYSGMETITNIKNNKIAISKIEIKKTSPVRNKKIKDIMIPKDCVLASVIKKLGIMKPDEQLFIEEGDWVILISSFENKKLLRNIFVGTPKEV
jgi:trk system potassium uptake protein TrkA